ncbi:phage integrase SAM-like domain-containing protein [Bacteroides ovatus]|jgi:integrase|uniref:site-specific integrase n=1 Tax=Bacteroides ovatus TaxID=28116 RepID=UPI00233F17C1|nr:site-specific integrase [Bacteroides ovatus]MDC2364862.1 phage integrase SAM-like domain-containing protein [Bacteroides ovatus]
MIEQIFINETVSANFNLRQPKSRKPTNIYLVVRINQKQAKFSTGVKVYPEQWNTKKQEAFISCRLTESDNINNIITNKKLIEIKKQFEDFKNYLCTNPSELENGWELLKKYIHKDTAMKKDKKTNALWWLQDTIAKDKTIKGSKDGKRGSTREVYQSILDDFKSFLELKKGKDSISFDDINLGLIKDYEEYLFNKKVNASKTTATNTVGNKCTQLIAMIKRAEPFGLIDIHTAQLDKYRKPKSRQGDENEIYLSEDEIKKIYSLELPYTETKIRDVFVLLCWTGQRYSDINSLNEGIIKEVEGGEVLDIVQTKTSHKVSIPLFPIAKEILKKYEFNLPIFPSNTILRYLRKIGKKAGLTEKHNVIKDRGGEVETISKYRWELIGTHTARRSYINNMLKRQCDSHLLMKVTGHKSEASFKRYVKLSSEEAASTILRTEAVETNSRGGISTTYKEQEKSEEETDIFNYIFAGDLWLKLNDLLKKRICINQLPETREAVKVLKDIGRIDTVDISKYANNAELKKKVSQISFIVWNIGRMTDDIQLIQLFQNNIISLGLNSKNIGRVMEEKEIRDFFKYLLYDGNIIEETGLFHNGLFIPAIPPKD